MGVRRNSPRGVAARLALAAAGFAVLLFAVQGGEWGTLDLFRQRARIARIRLAVDSLRREVDSLSSRRKAIENDPQLQEKIAREEFGMVRGNKELLYRFTEPGAVSGKRP